MGYVETRSIRSHGLRSDAAKSRTSDGERASESSGVFFAIGGRRRRFEPPSIGDVLPPRSRRLPSLLSLFSPRHRIRIDRISRMTRAHKRKIPLSLHRKPRSHQPPKKTQSQQDARSRSRAQAQVAPPLAAVGRQGLQEVAPGLRVEEAVRRGVARQGHRAREDVSLGRWSAGGEDDDERERERQSGLPPLLLLASCCLFSNQRGGISCSPPPPRRNLPLPQLHSPSPLRNPHIVTALTSH